MYSHRFKVDIHITRHARERMATRNITESELLELVEQGSVKYKDATRLWIARYFEIVKTTSFLLQQSWKIK